MRVKFFDALAQLKKERERKPDNVRGGILVSGFPD
jgi:hypothetical protein